MPAPIHGTSRTWPSPWIDARDVARLKTGLRKVAALYRHPALAEAVTDPFPTSYSERIRDLGRINRKNLVLTGLLADHGGSARAAVANRCAAW